MQHLMRCREDTRPPHIALLPANHIADRQYLSLFYIGSAHYLMLTVDLTSLSHLFLSAALPKKEVSLCLRIVVR